MSNLSKEFIIFFSHLSQDPLNEINKWFEGKMTKADDRLSLFKNTADQLLRLNYIVEPYWILKTLKAIITENSISEVLNKLLIAIGEECKKRALLWLETIGSYTSEEYSHLSNNLTKNILTLLEAHPSICAMLINDEKSTMEKIETVGDKHFYPYGLFKICLNDLRESGTDKVEREENVTYGQIENGVIFLGVGIGQKIIEIFAKTLFPFHFPQIGIFVIETSLNRFKSFITISNDTRIFSEKRVNWFIGSSANVTFLDFFRKEDQFMPSFRYHTDPGVASLIIPEMNCIIREKKALTTKHQQTINDLFNENYDIDLLKAYKGRRPLRILGMTSLFTTFLQYCMRDILEGCKALGHEVDLAIEKETTLRLTNEYGYKKIIEFKPDLIISICYNRKDFSFCLPERTPFVNFQQDVMPHNLGRRAIEAISHRDFITVGRQALKWMKKEGYPENKILPIDFYPANTNIYKPLNLTPFQIKKYGSEVSFISHGSETAEEGFENIKKQLAGQGTEINALAKNYFEILIDRYQKWENYPVNNTQHEIILNTLLADMNIEVDQKLYDQLIKLFWHDVSEKLIRQIPIEALATSGIDIAL